VKSSFGGRPKLPRQQKRDQRVVTFLTGDERRQLEKIADDRNVSVSRTCHDLIVRSMEELGAFQPLTASNRQESK